MTDVSDGISSDTNRITHEFVNMVQKQMIAFAQLQLNDYHLAEDVVQDALIAALQHDNQFKAEAAFKSWVFAILKNKIIDCIRKNGKYVNVSSLQVAHNSSDAEQSGNDVLMDSLFNEAGSWYPEYKPSQFDNSWCDPHTHVHSDEFLQVLEVCLTNLPSEQARAFLMREYMEFATGEICETMQITNSHYYVLMHRARLKLQTCLTIKWFDNEDHDA